MGGASPPIVWHSTACKRVARAVYCMVRVRVPIAKHYMVGVRIVRAWIYVVAVRGKRTLYYTIRLGYGYRERGTTLHVH